MRLDALCKIINKIVSSLGDKCIVFFSESCKPSFLGTMDNKQHLVSWLSMRKKIEELCGFVYITESRNNENSNDMSLEVSVFSTKSAYEFIATYFLKNIFNRRSWF